MYPRRQKLMLAAMGSAAVVSAWMVAVGMVVTLNVRVIAERPGEQRVYSIVRIAVCAAVYADARFRKGGLRACADAAAD